MSFFYKFRERFEQVIQSKDLKELNQLLSENFEQSNDEKSLKTRSWMLAEIENIWNLEVTETVLSYITVRPEENFQEMLEAAIWTGNIPLSEFFLKNGITIHKDKVKDNFQAKNLFIYKNEMLTLLLQYNLLDPHQKNEYGRNILHEFIYNYVLKYNCNDEDAEMIIQTMINYKSSVNEIDSAGITPLIYTITANKFKITHLLVHNGVDVNQKDSFGLQKTPIIWATTYNRIEIIKLLVSNGADVNATDHFGCTALHEACQSHNPETIYTLIRAGADLNAVNSFDKTPLTTLMPFDFQIMVSNFSNEQTLNIYKSILIFTKELSKLVLENIELHKINTKFLKTNPNANDLFKKCKAELDRMNCTKFYGTLTYYSLLKKKCLKKILNLLNDEELLIKFQQQCKTLLYYDDDLHKIFDEAVQLKEEFESVYSKIKSVFKNFLPDLVLRKLAENLKIDDLT